MTTIPDLRLAPQFFRYMRRPHFVLHKNLKSLCFIMVSRFGFFFTFVFIGISLLLHHGVKFYTFCAYLLPQGLHVVTMATVLRGVKVLSLSNKSLSLNAVLNVMKCFPCLEMLNIQVSTVFICINYFVTQYSIDTCSRVDCHYF